MSNSHRMALVSALLFSSTAALAAAPEVAQVTMDEFQVDNSPRLLNLVGKNFTNSTVTLGGYPAIIVDQTDSILSVEIPSALPYGDFEVALTNTTVVKNGRNGTVVETYRFMWTHANLEGIEGPQGPEGPEGPEGPRGPQGEAGPQGEKGETGEQGIQGTPGPKGDKGDQGDVGPQGLKGDTGEQGIQGIQGPKGDKGDTGEQGPQGEQGIQGLMGPQGLKGDKGDKGDVGPQGEKGDKGDTGEQGIQGPPGAGSGIHAVVASDGSRVLARSNGLSDSVREAKGSYLLTFSRDVSACAWVASAAGAASVSATEVDSMVNQIGVTTVGVNGKAEDSGFTIIVSCPPAN
ncbi:MAG: hypothetical protein ACO21O_10460 [Steroidobacteraceae bacterium]